MRDAWGKDTLVEDIIRLATAKRYHRKLDDPFLKTLKDVATKDSDYLTVLNHLKNKTPMKDLKKEPTSSPIHSYLTLWERLGILDDEEGSLMTIDNQCLVVPKKYRKKLLKISHLSHQGQLRTYKSLQTRYF